MEKPDNFKECTCCRFTWLRREDFVADIGISLIGYEANFNTLELGIFLFNHTCGTTLAIDAGTFRDMYSGPVYKERKTGGPDCRGYCLIRTELRVCHNKCECAWVRELIQTLRRKQDS